MKNFVKVLCFTLAFIIVVSAGLFGYIQWYKTDFDFVEGTEKGTVMITGYNGTDKDVKIPEKIRGQKVTKIDSLTFEDSDITSITVGNNITYIGKSAFRGCKSLKEVRLSNGILSIDEACFDGCTSLEEITLPKSVESLGIAVFGGCDSLKEVKLESEDNFVVRDGVLFSADMKTLYFALPYAELGNYTCPESVTQINDLAFSESKSLTGFTFNKNITSVSRGLFFGCTAMNELTLPSTIVKINSLITSNSSIKRITIPASVKEINELAFYDAENDETVSKDIIVVTSKGSKADEYAKTNGMKIEYIK